MKQILDVEDCKFFYVRRMPNLEEHCKRTLQRYGVEGRDIHSWLDEPSKEYAAGHRQFRHDTETVHMIGEIFGKTYGKSLAENIALDHIMLDHEEEIKKHTNIIVNLPEEREIPTIPCSYCNTLLRPSDQICPKCGASRTKITEGYDRAYEMEKLKLKEKKKNLRRELKLELALRELALEERIFLWRDSDWSYTANRLRITFGGIGWEAEKAIIEQDCLKRPSQDQIEALYKLGLYEPIGKVVLDRLAQEDFEKHPELKEQVCKGIELVRSTAEVITKRRAEEEKKKFRFSFNPFKRSK